jgi:uncharacterized membrane protein
MANKNKQLVLAFFDNEAAADSAVAALKSWDKADKDIKLGAIGVLVKDDKGKIKEHKLGARSTARGVGVGVILGILAALLPAVTLLGGIVGGGVLFGVLGSFVHKSLGISKEDLQRYSADLDKGRAAVGVLVDDADAKATMEQLQKAGGKPESHEVTEDALDHAAAAVDAPAATEPVESASTASTPAASAPTADAPAASAPAGETKP